MASLIFLAIPFFILLGFVVWKVLKHFNMFRSPQPQLSPLLPPGLAGRSILRFDADNRNTSPNKTVRFTQETLDQDHHNRLERVRNILKKEHDESVIVKTCEELGIDPNDLHELAY
ncbi:hypothetical protein BDZ45DRAFT_683328 [Acephala macrosclerotiorum]|nr:hypothetical protein BDZ45DRAFT_683328 [Acephala macrosclerotiorum]